MKKMSFVVILLCLPLAVACPSNPRRTEPNAVKAKAPTAEPRNLRVDVNSVPEVPVRLGLQANQPLPIELKIDSNAALPVLVQTTSNEPLAVKIQTDEPKDNRIEVKLQDDKPLRVEGKDQTDRWFLVDVRTTRAVILSLVVAVGAAVGACVGGVGACRSAKATRLAAEGQLFYKQLQDYASKEMRDDLRLLFKWYREDCRKDPKIADELAGKLVKNLFSSDDQEADKKKTADKIDVARRHVTHYFLNILQLRASRHVKKRFLKGMCQAVGTRVLDAVLPLEEALIRYIAEEEGWKLGEDIKQIEKLKSKFDMLKKLSSGESFRS